MAEACLAGWLNTCLCDGLLSCSHHVCEVCVRMNTVIPFCVPMYEQHKHMGRVENTSTLVGVICFPRRAQMMKNLFAGGPLDATGGPPLLDATTHKAETKTTLPASAAAAIAAAQAAAAASDDGNGTKDGDDDVGTFGSGTFHSKNASVEWDFGEEDTDFAAAASVAAAGLGALDFRTPTAAEGVEGGRGGVGMSLGEVEVMPPASPGAVTPKARGGSSGGMWLDGLAAEEDSVVTALEPPPLAERQRRQGVGVLVLSHQLVEGDGEGEGGREEWSGRYFSACALHKVVR